MLRRSLLDRLERKLERALKELEKRERRARAIVSRLERVYARLPPLADMLERARDVDAELYEQLMPAVKEAHAEVMELANELDELVSFIEREREKLQRLLALVQLLKERSRRR